MQALILEQQDGKTLASVQHLEESQLPAGDVTVDVHWSSLNYKDALAITGKGKIIRHFPMILVLISPAPFTQAKILAFMQARSTTDWLGRGRKPLGRPGRTRTR